jgi:hypothetical protein
MRATDLRGYGHGLETETQRDTDRLLHDYDPNLSLRKIPERDPAFTPGKPFGVYEEGTLGLTPWVFTLAGYACDERVLARVAAGDMAKRGVREDMAKVQAQALAKKAAQDRQRAVELQDRTDEMLSVGKMAERYSRFTMTDQRTGERVIVDGEAQVHTGRKFIV